MFVKILKNFVLPSLVWQTFSQLLQSQDSNKMKCKGVTNKKETTTTKNRRWWDERMIKYKIFCPKAYKYLNEHDTIKWKAYTLKVRIHNLGFGHFVLKMLRDFKYTFFFIFRPKSSHNIFNSPDAECSQFCTWLKLYTFSLWGKRPVPLHLPQPPPAASAVGCGAEVISLEV